MEIHISNIGEHARDSVIDRIFQMIEEAGKLGWPVLGFAFKSRPEIVSQSSQGRVDVAVIYVASEV